MAKELTDNQKAFCDEYLVDFNATQAAIRAGYSEKTANRIASRNLFGLGDAEVVDQIAVRWPSGREQIVSGPVATNSLVEVREL